MLTLYIIGGCNGAGKTTASFTIFPEILQCREYVNADKIAKIHNSAAWNHLMKIHPNTI